MVDFVLSYCPICVLFVKIYERLVGGGFCVVLLPNMCFVCVKIYERFVGGGFCVVLLPNMCFVCVVIFLRGSVAVDFVLSYCPICVLFV